MNYLLSVAFILLTLHVQGQKNNLKKSWVKVDTHDLSGTNATLDTLYTRYTFEKANVYMSFEPAWDDYILAWQAEGKDIRIDFQDYKIMELTDSSLLLEAPGFRSIRFLAEEYLISKTDLPIIVDSLNDKPVYLANRVITPRYQKGKSLSMELEKNSHDYNIRQLATLRIDFTVDEKGTVHDIKIINGIAYGLDKAMKEAIAKTSKRWIPATHNGKSIQTRMSFIRKYINTEPGGKL